MKEELRVFAVLLPLQSSLCGPLRGSSCTLLVSVLLPNLPRQSCLEIPHSYSIMHLKQERPDIALKENEKYSMPECCLGLHPVLTLSLAAVIMNGTNQFQEISTTSIMSHMVTSFPLTSRASC